MPIGVSLKMMLEIGSHGRSRTFPQKEERWRELSEQLIYRRAHLGEDESPENIDLVRAQLCETALEEGEALSLYVGCLPSADHAAEAYQGVRRLFMEYSHGEELGLESHALAKTLEALARERNDDVALIATLECLLEQGEVGADSVGALLELIGLYADQAEYWDRQFIQYERLLEIAPTAENRAAFRRFSKKCDRSSAFADRLLDAVQTLDDPDERVAVLLELADVHRTELDDLEQCEDLLRTVLDECPGQADAL